jgi:hypothetical protein
MEKCTAVRGSHFVTSPEKNEHKILQGVLELRICRDWCGRFGFYRYFLSGGLRTNTFMRTEYLLTISRADGYGISCGDECAAGTTADQISGRDLFAADLFPQISDIVDCSSQIVTQPGDHFQRVHDKAENQQDQHKAKDNRHFLPPGLSGP